MSSKLTISSKKPASYDFYFQKCNGETALLFSIKFNLSDSIKEKSTETLTKNTAIKILKKIKLKSDVLSFFTRPIVFNTLLSALMNASIVGLLGLLAISTGGMVPLGLVIGLMVSSVIFGLVVGGVMERKGSENPHDIVFLYRAYKEQSMEAQRLINLLSKKNDDCRIDFEPEIETNSK